jgi:PAS domain S-box-containing protein
MLEKQPPFDDQFTESLLQAAGCCRVKLDAEGFIQQIDPHILTIAGHTADELRGKLFFDLILSDWKNKVRDWQQSLTMSDSCEFPLRTHYGDSCWVRYTHIPANDANSSSGLLQDITFIKNQEKALTEKNILFRNIIDNIPIAIHAKNTTGEYILSNPTHYQLLGKGRRVVAHARHVKRVQGESGSLDALVMAGDAVLVENSARGGRRCGRVRGRNLLWRGAV